MKKNKEFTIRKRALKIDEILVILLEDIVAQRYREDHYGDHHLSIEIEPGKKLMEELLENEKKGYLTYDSNSRIIWLSNQYDWNLRYDWVEI